MYQSSIDDVDVLDCDAAVVIKSEMFCAGRIGKHLQSLDLPCKSGRLVKGRPSSKGELQRYWLSSRNYAIVARVAEFLVPQLQKLISEIDHAENVGAVTVNQHDQVCSLGIRQN